MQAKNIADVLIARIIQGKYAFYVVNLANGDMVGHTGDLKSTIKGCEIIDKCVGRIVDAVLARKGNCVITADHGNCEDMSGREATTHTISKVPFFLIGKYVKLRNGGLRDVAPTILDLFEIRKPRVMDGKSLMK